MFERSFGQSLPEYALIGSLVLVVSIAGIMAIGDVLTGEFQRVPGILTNGSSTAGVDDFTAGELTVLTEAPGEGTTSTTVGASYSRTDIAQQIEVGGSSGGVDTIAARIKALAQKLQQDGGDPSMVADLLGLAESGHQLANDIGLTEDQFTVTETDVYDLQNGESAEDGVTSIGGGINNIAESRDIFNQKFQEVISRLNNDPGLQGTIDMLGKDILTVSDAFSGEEVRVTQSMENSGNYQGNDFQDYADPNAINANVASALIHEDSDSIASYDEQS